MNASIPSLSPFDVFASTSPDVLRRVRDRWTLAAIWRRPLASPIARGLSPHASTPPLERGLLLWSHDHRRTPLEPLVADVAPGEARDALVADMRGLVERWYGSARLAHAYVSLAWVVDDGCPALHADRVGLRLLTTYVGAGTQWLSPADADVWRRDPCCFDARSLHALAPGDVLLLKGAAHPDVDGGGLVHRSPPRAESGQARLLFRICDGEYHLRRMLEGRASNEPT